MPSQSNARRGLVEGKVAAVTGGLGGIGFGIAKRLGEEGARVVLTDFNPAESASALVALKALGVEAAFLEHDVRTLTKRAAVMCARQGIPVRINAIHPSYIRTPLTEGSTVARVCKDNAIQALKDLHPFQCLGEPDDVAYAVVYLASDESRLVNAADLVVDGALLAS